MKRNTLLVLASLVPMSACGGDKTTPPPAPAAKTATTPAATPVKPAEKPAEPPAKPAETPAATATQPAGTPAAPPAGSPNPPAETDVDTAYKTLMAKPEQAVDKIEIQHVLIGFKGAPRLDKVTRSKEEAKVLAQKVFTEAIGGANFDALVKQYTDDSAPGIYPLDQQSRKSMVKDFGDVGFRLKVGEIGVAPWNATTSVFGWHIIKRLK